MDVSLVDEIWMPDIEILNLKKFSTLDVLSKLEGLWLNRDMELIYAVACRLVSAETSAQSNSYSA